MREGLWINYKTGKTFPIHEHEQWLRGKGNAKKLGVPPKVISAFKKFKPGGDRDKFLLFVMKNAPVMRVRGHGQSVSFEYSSRNRHDPMDAIWMWGQRNAGPFTHLYIVNFATRESTQMFWQEFEENMEKGGAQAVMRAASTEKFEIQDSISKEMASLRRRLR